MPRLTDDAIRQMTPQQLRDNYKRARYLAARNRATFTELDELVDALADELTERMGFDSFLDLDRAVCAELTRTAH